MRHYMIRFEDPDESLAGWTEVVLAPNPERAVYIMTEEPVAIVAGEDVLPDDGDSWRAVVTELCGPPPRLSSEAKPCGVWWFKNVDGRLEIEKGT